MVEVNQLKPTKRLLGALFAVLFAGFLFAGYADNANQIQYPSYLDASTYFQSLTGFAVVYFPSGNNSVSNNSGIRMDINARDVVDLGGVQIDINYDPSVLRYDHVSEGTFLSSGGATTFFLDTINSSTPGLVKNIAIVRTGNGMSGSGLLASVHFVSITNGTANLSFGQFLLSDSNATPIPGNDTINATIVITAGEYCGNGVCGALEDCTLCPSDCGNCPPNVEVPTGSGGGNSGGGGGGGIIPPRKNTTANTTAKPQTDQTIITETLDMTRVITTLSTVTKRISLVDTTQPIKTIVFQKESAPKRITVDIKETQKPESVPGPGGITYKYLQLDSDDKNLKDIQLEFEIDKEWVEANNIDFAKVMLRRYTSSWDELSTSVISEDEKSYRYQTTTPGFSIFAITAEENPTEKKGPPPPEMIDVPGTSKKMPIYWPIIFVVVLAVFIFLAVREVKVLREYESQHEQLQTIRDEELKDYLQKAITKGMPESEILDECAKTGWNRERVAKLYDEELKK